MPVDYSTPSYSPGKLVDEGGQGSTNDNYGITVQVPGYEPPASAGNVYGNPTPILRVGDLVAFGLGAALFAVAAPAAAELKRGKRKKRRSKAKKKTDFTRIIGAVVMGAAVVGVVARWVSPNFDSATSMVPGNVGV